jgi:hypothetical protein
VDGRIQADGTGVEQYGGCGSGGSLWLTACRLAGTGVISANGGGTDGRGGGGGGGRIALYLCELDMDPSLVTVEGGQGSGPGNAGTDGTIHWRFGTPQRISVGSSSDVETWNETVNHTTNLDVQLARLNAGPTDPSWSPTWQSDVHRHADVHIVSTFLYPEPDDTNGLIDPNDPNNVQGGLLKISAAPSDVTDGAQASDTSIAIFNECVGHRLEGAVVVDINWTGTYDARNPPSSEKPIIPGGTTVSCHMLHFDTLGGSDVFLSGTVTFDGPILGVIVEPNQLDDSDAELGASGTLYPTGDPMRGWELDDDPNIIIRLHPNPVDPSWAPRTLTVAGRVQAGLDQIRVITACKVADPLTEAYVNAQEFISGADEVTLNNRDSCFYRFTFELPEDFMEPDLSGIANVDDMAVAFLNGHRISGPRPRARSCLRASPDAEGSFARRKSESCGAGKPDRGRQQSEVR